MVGQDHALKLGEYECVKYHYHSFSFFVFLRRILTGCYDNIIHIWNEKAKHLLPVSGHAGPVKSVRWLGSGNEHDGFFFAR
jgi:WD40 repeat protein